MQRPGATTHPGALSSAIRPMRRARTRRRSGPPAGTLSKDATRNVLWVELRGPAGVMRLGNVHLSLDPAARRASVELLGPPDAAGPGFAVLAGDFNDVPGSPPLVALAAAGWAD